MSAENDRLLPWGVGCLVAAAVLYVTGRDFRIHAESLGRVIRINQIKDLSLLFDPAPIVLPLIVTISGKVGSNRPIKFEPSGLKPVILRETTTNYILKRQVKTEVDNRGNSKEVCSWKEEHKDTHTVNKEVPWYLDDGTSRVFVLNAQRASKFWESVAGHVGVYRSQILPVRGTVLDSSQRELDLVVKTTVTTKPVLVTGTPLTVIGEAVKDDLGRIRIQQPKKGPFYVSQKKIDVLRDDFKRAAWLGTRASVVFASFGIFLIGMHIFQYIRGRYWQHRILDAATETPGTDYQESRAEAGYRLGLTELIPDLCVICLQQEYKSAFVPCGHMCCCEECSLRLTECPLCRERINQVVRIFRG